MEDVMRRVSASMERIEPWVVLGGWRRYGVALGIALLLLSVAAMVYATGGIKYVYSHTMYIPIILAALFFSTTGGVLAGVMAGLLLGPYMPMSVATGEMQSAFNWLYRMLGFATIGGLVGFAFSLLRDQLEHMRWQARHDAVTGLPNRTSLEESVQQAVTGRDAPFALLAFSLAGLDHIRDTFGFVASSSLLCEVRDVLQSVLPEGESLFHYHPERFAIQVTDPGQVGRYTQWVVDCVRRPFNYNTFSVYLTPHIGVVHFPEHGAGSDELVQKADMAIWHACKQGLTRQRYESGFDEVSRENMRLMGMLSHALEAGQLQLHYQPKVNLKNGHTTGVEALLRWQHPERGMIPPGMFIPLCERTGLIHPVTAWVMQEAAGHLSAWNRDGLDPILAINISTRNLQDPLFYRQVRHLIDTHGIDPEKLELEITETAIMKNPAESISLLKQLRDMRLILSIDDFGTGYSSLSYLHRLPVGAIKIDQTFVRDAAHDAGVRHIIRAAADVGHALDLKVIAEGIEDAESLGIVSDLGCDIGQGYYISHPVPEAQLLAWFRDSGWPVATRAMA